ncbi:DUF4259 domain-containing protein [Streptomyces sp. NPDC056600]|uniref:DUF4259 domain-containing protein n=1 Tax=Streptomyces sp. NPDC056600 TaxID=3345874 RepID=UPI00369C1948
MGTWDTGPFDNDTAADFCGDLDDAPSGERAGMVRAVLLRAARTEATVYCDGDTGEKALAAAALVAAQCPRGASVTGDCGPEEPLPCLAHLRVLAAEAVERVLTEPSDLVEDWEGARGRTWRSRMHGVWEVLLPEPVGEQLACF